MIKRYALIENTADIDLSDINKSWLPRISAYAQATVQNHVPLRKDQYKVGVDVNQTIWDSGKLTSDLLTRNLERLRSMLVNGTTMPRIGLFAQAYYGYPGFDYFNSMMSGA